VLSFARSSVYVVVGLPTGNPSLGRPAGVCDSDAAGSCLGGVLPHKLRSGSGGSGQRVDPWAGQCRIGAAAAVSLFLPTHCGVRNARRLFVYRWSLTLHRSLPLDCGVRK